MGISHLCKFYWNVWSSLRALERACKRGAQWCLSVIHITLYLPLLLGALLVTKYIFYGKVNFFTISIYWIGDHFVFFFPAWDYEHIIFMRIVGISQMSLHSLKPQNFGLGPEIAMDFVIFNFRKEMYFSLNRWAAALSSPSLKPPHQYESRTGLW